MVVPSIAQVRPGAAVFIILKQDQRTGRQVAGLVQELLTKGNHPRGIKVRLQDGRIGRVQSMALGPVLEPSRDELQKDLRDQDAVRSGASRVYNSHRLNTKYADIRTEEQLEEPPAELDLLAFVKQPMQKKKRGAASKQAEQKESLVSEPAQTASCPVCADFEGDEAAVAHHVEQHFS